MQAREAHYSTRSRATLPLLELHSHPSLSNNRKVNWAMGVNNVANLFTPQGDADPMALLPMMVGVWQSAKPKDCEVLLRAVSRGGRVASGLDAEYDDKPPQGEGTEKGEDGGQWGRFGQISRYLTAARRSKTLFLHLVIPGLQLKTVVS